MNVCIKAMMDGDLDEVKNLLLKGEKKDFLIWASIYGKIDIVKYLVESEKFNVNEVDELGRTALYWASFHNKFEIVKYLVSKGADIIVKDERGEPALDLANREKEVDVCNYLENLKIKHERNIDF